MLTTVFIICATVGGTLIVCQFIMTLIGLGGDHDVGGDHDLGGDVHGGDVHADVGDQDVGHEATGHHATNLLFTIITFRTITAGLAFFGLTGWVLQDSYPDMSKTWVLLGAVGAGLLAIFVVATIMRSLSKLNTDGTIRITRAVGSIGTVYLPIPGARSGAGKVHVSVQGQLKEYRAVTSHGELPTGTEIVVVKTIGSDTVEVSPVESLETTQQS